MCRTSVTRSLFLFVFLLFVTSGRSQAGNEDADVLNENTIDEEAETQNCWMDVKPGNFFKTMKEIEVKHEDTIKAFERAIVPERMNEEMLKSFVNTRGVSGQAVEENLGRIDLIPAGLDLGGYCMLRMQESILFFHRMKLRNSTNFKIKYLQNDLRNLVLRTRLSLNDLHLQGTYERLMTDRIPSNLFYSPTYGKVEIMLKQVEYKMEARYRMLGDRLLIELVISALKLTGAIMVTEDASGLNKSPPIQLHFNHLEDLLQRLKTDLDIWIKDCFNDKLINFGLSDQATNEKFYAYQREKTDAVNNYMQFLLGAIQKRMIDLHMEAIAIPDFSIFSVDGMIFRLRNGVIRGLDTLYKRSVASSYIESPVGLLRHLCAEIGFSNLQVTYAYEALAESGAEALTGSLILSAKDLTALFSAGIVMNPNSVEFVFQSVKQLGPEALTIEGPASKVVGSFRHVIQNHVLALMTYSLNYQVKNLWTLTDCEPNIVPFLEPFHDIKVPNTIHKRKRESKQNQMLRKVSKGEEDEGLLDFILDFFYEDGQNNTSSDVDSGDNDQDCNSSDKDCNRNTTVKLDKNNRKDDNNTRRNDDNNQKHKDDENNNKNVTESKQANKNNQTKKRNHELARQLRRRFRLLKDFL